MDEILLNTIEEFHTNKIRCKILLPYNKDEYTVYTGIILKYSESFIIFLDKFNEKKTIRCSEILKIEEAEDER